jgi:hypothetical protein
LTGHRSHPNFAQWPNEDTRFPHMWSRCAPPYKLFGTIAFKPRFHLFQEVCRTSFPIQDIVPTGSYNAGTDRFLTQRSHKVELKFKKGDLWRGSQILFAH